MTDTLNEAMQHVDKYSRHSGGTQTLVPPLVYTSVVRGGKTTFLLLLFEELKRTGYAPIFISFSSPLLRTDESISHALARYIALQLCDPMSIDHKVDAVVDELELHAHIERTSGGKPVVLLIDDLHRLGVSLNAVATLLLTKRWLDQRNRYLVYSSNVPMELDVNMLHRVAVVGSAPVQARRVSERSSVTVKHPQCLNTATLSNMCLPRIVPTSCPVCRHPFTIVRTRGHR